MTRTVLPGLLLCVAISLAAVGLERLELLLAGRAWIESLVIAILVGMLVRTLWFPSERWQPGIDFSARFLLELAVVLLGASLSAQAVAAAGPALLVGIAAVVGVSLIVTYALGRAAGETAPIMFTAAAFFSPDLATSVYDEIMALPYHIYVLATAGTHIQETRPLQYGTAIVLIALVLLLNMTALILRSRFRNRML